MSQAKRWLRALPAAGLILGLAAEPATAKISFKGIGKVKLHASGDAVRKRLGPPASTKDGTIVETTIWSYPRQKLWVTLRDSRVLGVETTSRDERTSDGLGVGSREDVLRRELRRESCSRVRSLTICGVYTRGAGIGFTIRRGKVVRVTVGVTS